MSEVVNIKLTDSELADICLKIAEMEGTSTGIIAILAQLNLSSRHAFLNCVSEKFGRSVSVVSDLDAIEKFAINYLDEKGIKYSKHSKYGIFDFDNMSMSDRVKAVEDDIKHARK